MIGYSFLILLVLLPYVHSAFCKASGRNILDTNGNKIFLKGISLGNWLNAEGYMLNLDNISSFRLIDTAFSELLSQEKADKFWVDFQDNYITADDFKYIKSVGFNVIRLPFNYKLLMDENGENIEGGWKWLNFAITQCKNVRDISFRIISIWCWIFTPLQEDRLEPTLMTLMVTLSSTNPATTEA